MISGSNRGGSFGSTSLASSSPQIRSRGEWQSVRAVTHITTISKKSCPELHLGGGELHWRRRWRPQCRGGETRIPSPSHAQRGRIARVGGGATAAFPDRN
ncbi:hypothetical protein OROMI_023983 [Orobanche minor]